MSSPSGKKRTIRRRWPFPLLLITLICGGWFIYAWLHPTLKPVTKRIVPKDTRFIFSANGTGYPAIECYESSRTVLDDRCQRADTPPHPEGQGFVSPTRRVIAAECAIPTPLGSPYDQYEVMPLWRDGKPITTGETIELPMSGILILTDDGMVCRLPCFLHRPDGRKIELPVGTWPGIPAVVEPGLVATMEGTAMGTNVVLFDLQARKPRKLVRLGITSGMTVMQLGMLFRNGRCCLLVPGFGTPALYQGETRLATFGAVGWQWMWGEDGTVWGADPKGAVSLLRWRDAMPRLEKLPVPLKLDSAMCDMAPERTGLYFARFSHLVSPLMPRSAISLSAPTSTPLSPPSALPAAWGDGRLLAVTETRPTIPARVIPVTDVIVSMLKQPRIPRQTRILTLYRDGKKIGTCATHLLEPSPKPAVSPGGSLMYVNSNGREYPEHLAFTRDGKYLSWIINTGDRTEVYAFETGIW